jgi:hypothetical protein
MPHFTANDDGEQHPAERLRLFRHPGRRTAEHGQHHQQRQIENEMKAQVGQAQL